MVNQNKEYYLGLYEKSMPNTLSWEEKLKVVKEAGFDYLEMSIDETEEKLARLDQSVDEIEKAIEKTGAVSYTHLQSRSFVEMKLESERMRFAQAENIFSLVSKGALFNISLSFYATSFERRSRIWKKPLYPRYFAILTMEASLA